MNFDFLKRILSRNFKNYIKLVLDYLNDFKLYKKYSTIFSVNSFRNKEAILILNYHGIEKGLLHEKIKPRFAIDRIQEINKLLFDNEIISQISQSQIYIGYKIAIEYYEIHEKMNVDISDYYKKFEYLKYIELVQKVDSYNFISGSEKLKYEELYKDNKSFLDFAKSRKSIRNFTGEKVNIDILKNVIELANSSPSVCNRQASKVFLIENKSTIDKCLEIQGGFNGFSKNVNQLMILTVDRSYFYITGERYQFYIDGGIYLLNLLYALHYYKVAACPANWGKDFTTDNKLRKIVNIDESEQVICLIPIGVAQEEFAVTLSYRRTVDEVFQVIK
ncbi:nitroreductase family protein [Acinetobacter terrae]|uniref:Nitroreductase family protein n=1 Tax=Acinetobacter terrae TaxID=2731247 RepID=A0A8E4GM20_9GAMM|nr:nitroreductase family protein [Acinetobacter terrae]NNH38941.1 nitroreductase family protein [Acinetobacter terrae]